MDWFAWINVGCACVHTVSTIAVLTAGLIDANVRDYTLPVGTCITINGTITTMHVSSVPVLPFVVVPGAISAFWHWWIAAMDDTGDIVVTGMNVWRWVDYWASSAIMIGGIALLSGVADAWVLSGVMLAQSFFMVVSGVVESSDLPLTTHLGVAIVTSVYYCIVVWGPVLYAFTENAPPEFVIAIVSTLFVLFALFGVVYVVAAVRWFEPFETEVMYATLSIMAKTLLQWLVYGGIAGQSEGNTTAVAISVPVILVGGCVLGAVFWKSKSLV